jgi:hypothetical protein
LRKEDLDTLLGAANRVERDSEGERFLHASAHAVVSPCLKARSGTMSQEQTASQGMKAYIHEDDYGAVELLPTDAWDRCEQQLGLIRGDVEDYWDPDDRGRTSREVPDESPMRFVDLGLTLDELDAALSLLPFTDEVLTGYASDWGPVSSRTRAWVVDDDTGLAFFANWEESGCVRSIFCTPARVSPNKLPLFLAALKALGALRSLLLVDWFAKTLVWLDESERLEHWARRKVRT